MVEVVLTGTQVTGGVVGVVLTGTRVQGVVGVVLTGTRVTRSGADGHTGERGGSGRSGPVTVL